jgi:hypothetical protein
MKDPDDEGERRMLFVEAGGNVAEGQNGIPYWVKSRDDTPYIQWSPTHVAIDGDDVLRRMNEIAAEQAKDPTKHAMARECGDWLRDLLTGVTLPVTEILARGRQASYTPDQIKRAKQNLGVQHKQGFPVDGKRPYLWYLP